MRTLKLISLLSAGFALATTANAQFCVDSAGGGAIFDQGGTFPTTMPGASSACVTVPGNVTSITSVDVAGLNHTWMGDVQMTLEDPNGVEHLIFLRPGYLNTSNFGNSGDFLVGDYSFVESGGAALPSSSSGVSIGGGSYNQSFTSGGVAWTDGQNGINNTAMSAISGPQGDWCVNFYDWAGGDSGGFTGVTVCGETDGNECYLTIGSGPGDASFTPDDVTIQTNLDNVDLHYAVLLNSMPEFVIPSVRPAVFGNNGSVRLTQRPTRSFAVQVQMYNPEVFPTNPHHHSNGLLVNIDNLGNVNTVSFGSGTMSVWAQTGTNHSGERIVKFPFTMPQ